MILKQKAGVPWHELARCSKGFVDGNEEKHLKADLTGIAASVQNLDRSIHFLD
jgi:hypothetical protein